MSGKGVLVFLLLFAFVFSLPVVSFAQAEPEKPKTISLSLETTAESVVLIEAGSGKILFEKEPHKRLPMASVTKLMTLLLAVEAVEQGKFKLDDKVVTSENAWEMGGSQVYLEPGEEMSLWDMLLAVGVGSANDASVAVAEHIAGTEGVFVQAMNEKADAMGLKNTRFANSHGLPAKDHYTSSYDMAMILREGLKYPLFKKISAVKEYDLRGGAFKLWNTNKLLWWYDGADAGKTGWTEEAKYCLASSAERNGLRLIAVVLGTPEPRSHFRESEKIFNYGFARYKAVNMAEKGAVVKELKVGKGQVDNVGVLTAERVSVAAPKGEDKGFENRLELPKQLDAPVKKGQVIGSYVVIKNGQEIRRVDLIAGDDVPKAKLSRQIRRVLEKVY